MANAIKAFIGAVKEKRRANANIKALKPQIEQRKAKNAQTQFDRGIGKAPKTKYQADKMLGGFR